MPLSVTEANNRQPSAAGAAKGEVQVVIRPATEADIGAVVALAAANREYLGETAEIAAGLPTRVGRGEILVAATSEGEVVGFVLFRHHYQEDDPRTTVHYLCTAFPVRGRGIGRRLMAAVAADARRHRKRELVLQCPAHLPANSFYRRLGFSLQSDSDSGGGLVPLMNLWRLVLQ